MVEKSSPINYGDCWAFVGPSFTILIHFTSSRENPSRGRRQQIKPYQAQKHTESRCCDTPLLFCWSVGYHVLKHAFLLLSVWFAILGNDAWNCVAGCKHCSFVHAHLGWSRHIPSPQVSSYYEAIARIPLATLTLISRYLPGRLGSTRLTGAEFLDSFKASIIRTMKILEPHAFQQTLSWHSWFILKQLVCFLLFIWFLVLVKISYMRWFFFYYYSYVTYPYISYSLYKDFLAGYIRCCPPPWRGWFWE